MFISPAFAQAAGGGGAAGGIASLVPLILIFVVFYFLLIRPQQKKMKQHKEMLQAVRRGDRVVTGGGIIGTVTKVSGDDEVTVEIAEGVKVKVRRSMLADTLSKTEPAKAESDKTGSGEGKGGNGESGDAGGEGGPKQPASVLKGLLGGRKSD